MAQGHFYTISEAARLLGKSQNRKLIRKLLELKKTKTFRIGNSICIDQEGFDALSEAVQSWDHRLRLSNLAATA